jgi:ATP-dependent DNA helicase PIF1
MNIIDNYKDLIDEYNVSNPDTPILIDTITYSKEQEDAFDLYKQGKSFVLFGSAGSGKSLMIHKMKEYTEKNQLSKRLHITATTGISAYNISGITYQSFMGIGTGEEPVANLLTKIKKNKSTLQRIRSTDILIIDEISMMSSDIFDKLNIIFQVFKFNKKFFGGIQLILSGDMLQNTAIFKDNEPKTLLIENKTFNTTFNIKKNNIIILNKIFRQDNIEFQNLLSNIRHGIITEQDTLMLESRNISNFPHIKDLLELTPTNAKANCINTQKLSQLNSSLFQSDARFTRSGINDVIENLLEKELIKQLTTKNALQLQLKIGARVMLTKNIDVLSGLCNGNTGIILNIINNALQIKFDNNTIHLITLQEFKLELDNCYCIAIQYPVILCFGSTITKCQGLSLKEAILDLSNCFCDHQVYSALSRLRSLDGLYIRSYNRDRVMVNQKCIEWLEKLK